LLLAHPGGATLSPFISSECAFSLQVLANPLVQARSLLSFLLKSGLFAQR